MLKQLYTNVTYRKKECKKCMIIRIVREADKEIIKVKNKVIKIGKKKVREAIDRITDLIELMPAIDTSAIGYLETVIEALEKQLPKKPKEEKDTYTYKIGEFRIGKCPKCAAEVSDRFGVCLDCEQRLDW